MLPADLSGEPQIKTAEQKKEETQVGCVFNCTQILVTNSAPRHPAMEIPHIREEGAKSTGIAADNVAATGVNQQCIPSEDDLGGTVRVCEERQRRRWPVLISHRVGKERSRRNAGIHGGGYSQTGVSFGPGRDL